MTQPPPFYVDPPGSTFDWSARADHFRRQPETMANRATLAPFVTEELQQSTDMSPAAERLSGCRLEEGQRRPLKAKELGLERIVQVAADAATVTHTTGSP